MTAKERLHEIVNELTAPEAAEALERLEEWRQGRGVVCGIPYGPDEDPVLSAEDERAIREAEAAIASGDRVGVEAVRARLSELRRELG